jgi:PAS domain S-box-containing protein
MKLAGFPSNVPLSLDSALLDLLPAAVYVCDASGTILHANEAALHLLGYPREEYVGSHIARFYADQHAMQNILRRLQAGEEVRDYEARLVCQDGSIKHVLIDSNSLWDKDQLLHTRCFMRDITAQKHAEEVLRTSEAQLRAVLDYAPVFLARCDKERRFTFVNQRYAQRLGLKPEDLIGKHIADGLGAEAYASFRQYVDQVLCGVPVEFEVDIPYARLGRRFMHCAYVPDRGSSGQVEGWIAVITDITARRQAEEQLRQQTHIAETLNRIGNTLAAEVDLQRILQVVTDETTQLTAAEFGAFFYNVTHQQGESYMLHTLSGAPREAFADFPMPRNTALFGPTFRGEAVIRLDDVQQDPRYGQNAPHFGIPAGHLPVRSYLAVPVISRGGAVLGGLFCGHSRMGVFTAQHEQLVVSIAAQAAIAIERKQAEEALRHLTDTLAQHVAERTAELSRANAALQEEIAQHKQAREQIERHQEALAHREKLAAMGSMLANVAHELNNPLSVVMMQADVLREEAGTSSLATHAAELTQAAERCVDIVHNFLSLARQYPPKRTRVALNDLIEATMKLLAYPLSVDTITVEHSLANDLPVLWGDPHQLQQVVMNLVTNAHQALRDISGPRQLTLTTRTDQARQRVVLEVADTGPGMPQHIQERIFEPFFTTKPPGVGTGLGLPFCLGIIEGHGGTITIDSVPAHGTVVCVELPVKPVPVHVDGPKPAVLPAARTKIILIVDDEPGITRAMAHLLRRDGHTVETAANGRLALEKCQGQDYELILCDLRMPELDGPGFYRALQQHHPHLCQRIMFLTGDTLSPEAQEFLQRAGVPRLTKPFTAAMVRRALQRL